MTGNNLRVYYVYVHFDPQTDEVVYVGKGCYGRAWDVTRNRGQHLDHVSWMKAQCEMGFNPHNFVRIIHSSCTEKEALQLEKEYMYKNGQPVFNRQAGEKNYQAKLTDEEARAIFTLAKEKRYTHNELADIYKVSRSAISMIASRKQWRAATSCLV